MYETENTGRTKKIIIIIGSLIVVSMIVFGVMVLVKKQPGVPVTTTAKNIFPFTVINRSPVVPVDNGTTNTPADVTGTDTNVQTDIVTADKIRKITEFPISGYQSYITTFTEKINVYDEKLKKQVTRDNIVASDHIVYARTDKGFIYTGDVTKNTIVQKQITDTIVPGVYESNILTNPYRIVYRYAIDDVIQSFLANISGITPVVQPVTKVATTSKTETTCTSDFSRNLKTGSRGNDVYTIQTFMNEKLGTTMKTDGIFGRETLSHMKKFQEFLKIPVTGIYDQATRDALSQTCATLAQSVPQDADATVPADLQVTKPKQITGKLLVSNIVAQTISPDGGSAFHIIADINNSRGVVMDANGKMREVFNSPLSEWYPNWVNEKLITMTTRASGYIDGYMYGLNPTTSNFKKIMGPLQGLTTLMSPDMNQVLYSVSDSQAGTVRLSLKKTRGIVSTDIGLTTLPEKCTWSPDSIMLYCMIPDVIPSGVYPDMWYQGVVLFSDTLWRYNTVTDELTQLAVFPESIDGVRLHTSPTGNYLYLMNKKDKTLWSVTLAK